MNYAKYQHAFYAHDEGQVNEIKKHLGLIGEKWIDDIVTGVVVVRGGDEVQSVAHLRFCYAFPLEIEILTYLEGPHWHQEKPEFKAGNPFVSHIGFHMEQDDPSPFPEVIPAQTLITTDHTNQFLIDEGRLYRYEIHECQSDGAASTVGVDLKYIWRRD